MVSDVGGSGFARAIPDAFVEDLATIPNNPVVTTVLAALMKGGQGCRFLAGGWTVGADGRLFYRHLGRRGGEIHVRVEPRGGLDGSASLEEQWSVVEGMSMLTVDVLMAVLVQLCDFRNGNRTRYPILAPTAISADRILAYKGITRWGRERAALRERVAEEMDRLQDLRVDIVRFPGWDSAIGRWNAWGVMLQGDRALDIETVVTAEKGDGRRVWLVRFGQWAQCWMNTQAKVWTVPLSRSLLQLDHRRNRGAQMMAKKIGLNNVMLWGAARSRVSWDRRINQMLEDVGELPEPQHRHPHWPGRTRDRFEEALFTLQEVELFRSVTWPDGLAPGEDQRVKGWVNTWLASKIRIERPLSPARAQGQAQARGEPQTLSE